MWIFNRVSLNSPLNSVFPLVISIRIERIISCEIVKFSVIMTNFLCQTPFFFVFFSDFRFDFNLQSSIIKFSVKFCISTCHLNSNWVNFLLWNCQIFCNYDILSLTNLFIPCFVLRFSLRFAFSIEYPSIHRWIVHFLVSFEFELSEFLLVKLSNFL